MISGAEIDWWPSDNAVAQTAAKKHSGEEQEWRAYRERVGSPAPATERLPDFPQVTRFVSRNPRRSRKRAVRVWFAGILCGYRA